MQVTGPVPEQLAPPVGVADTNVIPDAASVSTSLTVFAADGPLFETVMLYVVFAPSSTVATLVVTLISAVLGFTETAPSDQLEVALKSSDTGTIGAPVLELPVPVTSRFPLPPVLTFHCCTCGFDMVTVGAPPVASVSNTIPLTTLGTSSCELHADAGFALATHPATAPSAETKVPSGTVWSTPVNVVTPATTPSVTLDGMFTLTLTLKAPLAGASSDHISTRRVSPASLCAPRSVSAVPL